MAMREIKILLPGSLLRLVMNKCLEYGTTVGWDDLAKMNDVISVHVTKNSFKNQSTFKALVKANSRGAISRAFGRWPSSKGCTINYLKLMVCFIEGKETLISNFYGRHSDHTSFEEISILSPIMTHADLWQEILRQENPEESVAYSGSQYTDSPVIGNLINSSDIALAEASIVEQSTWSLLRNTVTLGDLYVDREIEDKIIGSVSGDTAKNSIKCVQGLAGAGKTSLLWKLAKRLKSEQGAFALFLKSSQLKSLEIAKILTELKKEVASKVIFLIDTIDLLLYNEEDRSFVVGCLKTLTAFNCSVIISSRPQELRVLSALGAELPLEKFELSNYSASELHIAIDNYSDIYFENESQEIRNTKTKEVLNFAANNKSLHDLCQSPLTLRMIFSIYAPDKIPPEINIFRLYKDFWTFRVISDTRLWIMSDNDSTKNIDLSETASGLALIMLSCSEPELRPEDYSTLLSEKNIPLRNVDILINRGVIKRDSKGFISFFHQTFFDHAAAQALVLKGRSKGLEAIESRLNIFSNESISVEIEFFLLPIYEQVLLLGSSSSFRQQVDQSLLRILNHSNTTYVNSGLYVYILYHKPNQAIQEKVAVLLEKLDNAHSILIKRFLSIASSISPNRIGLLLTELQIIWNRGIWNERFNVICVLEYILPHDTDSVKNFFIVNNIITTAAAQHSQSGKNQYTIIYKILVRIVIRLFDNNQVDLKIRMQELIPALGPAELLYTAELLLNKKSCDVNDVIEQVVYKIKANAASKNGDKSSTSYESASIVAKYWLMKWGPRASLTTIIESVGAEKNAFLKQTKLRALAERIDFYDKEQSEVVYSYFKTEIQLFDQVQWAKWLFSPLISSDFNRLPILVEMFLDDLRTEFEKSSPNNEVSTIYCEAFFNCIKPNIRVFDYLPAKVVFNLNAWSRFPRIIDIFFVALFAKYPLSIRAISNITESSNLSISDECVDRIYFNILDKSVTDEIAIEFIVQLLLKREMPATLNEVLVKSFGKSNIDSDKELLHRLLLKHKADLEKYIMRGLQKDDTDKEHYGRLWTTCIQNNLIPPPPAESVLEYFAFTKRMKLKSPILFGLIPYCQLKNKEELHIILNHLRPHLTGRFKTEAEECYLNILSKCNFPIDGFGEEIFTLVISDRKQQKSEQKVRLMKNIIIAQSKLSIELCYNLLNSFFTSPEIRQELDKKKNDLSHFMHGACLAFFSAGNDFYIDKFLNFLETTDIFLARSIVDSLFHIYDVYERHKRKILLLSNSTTVDPGIKILLRNHIKQRFVLDSHKNWEDVLSFA